MRVLIAGVSGFIGSSLAETLIGKNIEVYGISRSHGMLQDNVLKNQKFQHYSYDLSEDLKKDFTIGVESIDIVINLASQQPSSSALTWNDYYNNNVNVLNKLCELALSLDTKKFIHISTTSVYSKSYSLEKLTEDSSIGPQGQYGLSKYMSEELLRLFISEHKHIKSTILRLPSVIGERHLGGIADTYYSLAKKNQKIEVFNNGKNYRNLLHINDVLEALIALIEEPIDFDMPNNDSLLLGSSDSLSTLEIAKIIVSKLNSNSEVIAVNKKTGMNGNIFLDLSKIEKRLGLSTLSLRDGINLYLESKGET
jgi:UDP-glucuronate 4-epimerase